MDYFKYIFSERKSLVYWIGLLIIILIYTLISVIANYKISQAEWINLSDFIFPTLVIVSFFGFYSQGFINKKRQELFMNKYSNLIVKNSVKTIDVIVYFESYSARPLRSNYEAKINPKPKKDSFTIFQLDNLIGLLGHTYDFGLIKRQIKPLLISLNKNNIAKQYKFVKIPKVSTIKHLDKDIEIIFTESVFGIKKIKLIDWKK